jgi:hypothetical protein
VAELFALAHQAREIAKPNFDIPSNQVLISIHRLYVIHVCIRFSPLLMFLQLQCLCISLVNLVLIQYSTILQTEIFPSFVNSDQSMIKDIQGEKAAPLMHKEMV